MLLYARLTIILRAIDLLRVKLEFAKSYHISIHCRSTIRSTGDPSYGLTTTAYDALGRVTSVTHPDNNIASTGYTGNCSTVTDEQNKGRKSCTDGLGRLTQVFEDPGGLNYETDYQYGTLDNLTHVTEGSQTRTFAYDSLSRQLSAANPEAGPVTYTYDANGNVQTKQDARGITTTYAYDNLNRLTAKTYSDGTPSANFRYDESSVDNDGVFYSTLNTNGRLSHTWVKYPDGNFSVTIDSYNPMGRVQDLWQCTPYNCLTTSIWNTHYNYDLVGDVKSWTHPAGFTITNMINNAQQITQIQSSQTPQYLAQNITYTPWGAEQTLENGCAGSGCTDTLETYIYNNRLQPVMIELGNTSNVAADYCLVYNYYASVGNPNSCATPSQGTQGNNGSVMGFLYQDNVNSGYSHTTSNTYDNLGRLTSSVTTGNATYNLTFAYDRYGNMTCQTNAQTQGLCPNYSFDPTTNRINTSGFQYDAAGDLTTDGSYTYQYDAEGHLTGVDNGSTSSLAYNALGQEAETLFSGYQLQFQYDPQGRQVGTYSAGEGRWWNGNVLLGERVITRTWGWSFEHPNAQGTSTMATMTDGSVGMDELLYPWGQTWGYTGTAYGVYFGWMLGDPEAPNFFRGDHRSYNPGLGRWFTPDPGNAGADPANPQSWNAYSYAGNNPTTNIDPSGLKCIQLDDGSWGDNMGGGGCDLAGVDAGGNIKPDKVQVRGRRGSWAAAVGVNVGIGITNLMTSNANTFYTMLTVGQYSPNFPHVPAGSSIAAKIGAIAPLVGLALVGPGGEAGGAEDLLAIELGRPAWAKTAGGFVSWLEQFFDKTGTQLTSEQADALVEECKRLHIEIRLDPPQGKWGVHFNIGAKGQVHVAVPPSYDNPSLPKGREW